MNISQIDALVRTARENLKNINPGISCDIVVQIGNRQILPREFAERSIGLFQYPGIFSSNVERHARRFENHEQLRDRAEKLKKVPKSMKEADKAEDQAGRIRAALKHSLESAAFHEARCELRFHTLDMDAIQKIKEHEIVKKIGRTPMSRASIRVVIA